MPDCPQLDSHALDGAFRLAAWQATEGVAPFVVLGVARADGIVRIEGYGAPDGPPIGANAVCLVASITKPIVATAIMQLVAEGRLGLTAPLRTILPELTVDPPISAWHVLSHTTGLAELDVDQLVASGVDRPEVLRRLYALPSVCPPGTHYAYASTPFELLAKALERIDGVPFPEALRRRLLEPLGMTSTTFEPRADPVLAARVAPLLLPHIPADQRAASLATFTALRLAGGGLWSSAGDLLRFGRAMLRGGEFDGVTVLPRAQLELMIREVTVDGLGGNPDPLQANHYGLGWGRPGIATIGSRDAFGHGGVTGTGLWIDRGNDLAIVYLTGSWGFPTEPANAVRELVYAALG